MYAESEEYAERIFDMAKAILTKMNEDEEFAEESIKITRAIADAISNTSQNLKATCVIMAIANYLGQSLCDTYKPKTLSLPSKVIIDCIAVLSEQVLHNMNDLGSDKKERLQ